MSEHTKPAGAKAISRKKFLASLGVAGLTVMTGGLLANKAFGESVTSSVYGGETGLRLEGGSDTIAVKQFKGVLDRNGAIEIRHGLAGILPANVIQINAFVKLPDGKAREVSVNYVDDQVISIGGSLPDAPVRVGIVYVNANADW